ncbi:MAG: YgiT-type zinc finger protein [Myxococcaceae bacterium]
MRIDFCEYCSAPMEGRERRVTVNRHSGARHFIFEQVPARVCPRCGERYFSASVVRQMDRQMKSRRSRSHIISVPVISLGPAG